MNRSGGITKWSDKVYDLMTLTLRRAGFTGHLPDMMLTWLGMEGAKGSTHDEKWRHYLESHGAVGDDWEDMERSWLESLNYSGTVDAMLESYWRDQSKIPTEQEIFDQQLRPMKLELAKLIANQPDKDIPQWLNTINQLKIQLHSREKTPFSASVLFDGHPVHPLPNESPSDAYARQQEEARIKQQAKESRRLVFPKWFSDQHYTDMRKW